MWTGDSLTVIEWLGAAVLASVIGAICAPTQNRARVLWGLAFVFGLLLVDWIAAPTTAVLLPFLRPIVVSLVKSGAAATVFIVGVVAMMIGRRQPPNAAPKAFDLADLAQPEVPGRPAFAVPPAQKSKWTPSWHLKQAAIYLFTGSKWAHSGRDIFDAKVELLLSLRSGKITGWGAAHPGDTEQFQIDRGFWQGVDELNLDTSYAYSIRQSVPAYDIRLSREELQVVWPPKA